MIREVTVLTWLRVVFDAMVYVMSTLGPKPE